MAAYQNLIKPLLRDAWIFILDTLFPVRCLTCEAEGRFICSRCLSRLKLCDKQCCLMCQRPSPLGLTHPGCLTPHAADGLVSILNYRDQRVADVIIAGKYHSLPGAFEELGKFAADKIPQLMPQLKLAGAVLVPLPLHPRRLRWRGFNQAAILCESIGPKLDLPAMAALIRVKPTKTQKDLDKERRVKNIAGAFAINPSLKPLIANKDAILVDDVVTTGSTLQEAAKVLKRNGAKRVFCLTIAKD